MVKNLGRSVSLRHVRAFVEVGEQGSFTGAADRLAISQPALTTTINQLEDLLGARLFIRTTRRVELTDVGNDFLPVARGIVSDFDRAITAVHEAGKRHSGVVNIAVLPSLAITILPRAIELFAGDQPRIKIHIRDDNAKGVHRQVRLNESDFGLANKWEEDNQLEFTPIFQDRVGLVCHRNHDLARLKSGTEWLKLENHNFVGMSGDTGVHAMLHAIPNLPECVVTPEYEVLTMVALASLISANIAVSALPALAVPRMVDPPMEFIKLGKPTVWRQICIVTHKSRRLSSSAVMLREFLQRVLSQPRDLLSSELDVERNNLRG